MYSVAVFTPDLLTLFGTFLLSQQLELLKELLLLGLIMILEVFPLFLFFILPVFIARYS